MEPPSHALPALQVARSPSAVAHRRHPGHHNRHNPRNDSLVLSESRSLGVNVKAPRCHVFFFQGLNCLEQLGLRVGLAKPWRQRRGTSNSTQGRRVAAAGLAIWDLLDSIMSHISNYGARTTPVVGLGTSARGTSAQA
ncbi:hypothetical protein J3459_015991 [Metarhizium acridum]|nr:hypothetical protein J3459_015991 [Metarhizium acridum]